MRRFAYAVLLYNTVLFAGCEGPQRVCTTDLRTAVTGSLTDASGALVKPQSVTARVDGGDARACSVQYGSYFCWEQGGGTYEVSVTSGGETIIGEVEVSANECHVTKTVTLDFAIPGEPGLNGLDCPERRWLLAEVDMSGWSYLHVEDQRYIVPLPVDGKLRIYAPPGLAATEQAIPIRVGGGIGCDPGFATIATLTFVPQSQGCGYEVVALSLAEEAIDYCKRL